MGWLRCGAPPFRALAFASSASLWLPTPPHEWGGSAAVGLRLRGVGVVAIAMRMDAVLGRRLVVSVVVAFWLGLARAGETCDVMPSVVVTVDRYR